MKIHLLMIFIFGFYITAGLLSWRQCLNHNNNPRTSIGMHGIGPDSRSSHIAGYLGCNKVRHNMAYSSLTHWSTGCSRYNRSDPHTSHQVGSHRKNLDETE